MDEPASNEDIVERTTSGGSNDVERDAPDAFRFLVHTDVESRDDVTLEIADPRVRDQRLIPQQDPRPEAGAPVVVRDLSDSDEVLAALESPEATQVVVQGLSAEMLAALETSDRTPTGTVSEGAGDTLVQPLSDAFLAALETHVDGIDRSLNIIMYQGAEGRRIGRYYNQSRGGGGVGEGGGTGGGTGGGRGSPRGSGGGQRDDVPCRRSTPPFSRLEPIMAPDFLISFLQLLPWIRRCLGRALPRRA